MLLLFSATWTILSFLQLLLFKCIPGLYFFPLTQTFFLIMHPFGLTGCELDYLPQNNFCSQWFKLCADYVLILILVLLEDIFPVFLFGAAFVAPNCPPSITKLPERRGTARAPLLKRKKGAI